MEQRRWTRRRRRRRGWGRRRREPQIRDATGIAGLAHSARLVVTGATKYHEGGTAGVKKQCMQQSVSGV